jgi:hypothetical protein
MTYLTIIEYLKKKWHCLQCLTKSDHFDQAVTPSLGYILNVSQHLHEKSSHIRVLKPIAG